MSALHWAVQKGHTDIVRILMQHGASATLPNKVCSMHSSSETISAALWLYSGIEVYIIIIISASRITNLQRKRGSNGVWIIQRN